jgi:uncharacterized membrane protein YphA (DoxX/SURF4 family)
MSSNHTQTAKLMGGISSVARVLLGILFTVFGLNGFLHFLPAGSLPTGVAGQYLGALFQSPYLSVVVALELIGGLLLLANLYVALGLAVLAPIVVNILLFHILMAPAGMEPVLLASVLWIASIWNVRGAFAGLIQRRPAAEARNADAAFEARSATASSRM